MAPPEFEAQELQPEVSSAKIPWTLIWAIAAFLIGIIFRSGMGWGQNTNSIDNMTLSISRLEGSINNQQSAINALTEKYTQSDRSVYGELQKIESHLTYDDGRLDKIEAREK